MDESVLDKVWLAGYYPGDSVEVRIQIEREGLLYGKMDVDREESHGI